MKRNETDSTPDLLQPADRRHIERVDERRVRHKIDRIMAEAEIVQMLEWAEFDESTPEWERIATALAEYGFTVIRSWAISGKLYPKAADKKIRGLSRIKGLASPLTPEEAHDLAALVTMHAIHTFRTKVLQHPDPEKRWRPDGGASLRTFFVNWVLMKLPDVYQKWFDGRISQEQIVLDYEIASVSEMTGVPGARIIAEETITEFAVAVGPESMAVYLQKADGMTTNEIADMTSTTEAAVRSRITRERNRHLK